MRVAFELVARTCQPKCLISGPGPSGKNSLGDGVMRAKPSSLQLGSVRLNSSMTCKAAGVSSAVQCCSGTPRRLSATLLPTHLLGVDALLLRGAHGKDELVGPQDGPGVHEPVSCCVLDLTEAPPTCHRSTR